MVPVDAVGAGKLGSALLPKLTFPGLGPLPQTGRLNRGMRKCAFTQTSGQKTMEVERSNLIGSTLVDLSNRTAELRGYL